MKKVIAYIILIIFIAIYLMSSSSKLTDIFAEENNGPEPVIPSDKYRYGDLFGMSYLSQFQKMPDAPAKNALVACNTKPGTNLYIICDSYIESFFAEKRYYCGVDSLFRALIYDLAPMEVNINHAKKNILLLEIAERNIRETFDRTDHIHNLLTVKDAGRSSGEAHKAVASIFAGIKSFLFNDLINTNLELNTWDYSVFTPIKEFKADLNYKWFDKVDNNVVMSSDKKYLFYKPTVDSSVITSSFQAVGDAEIQSIVEKLNGIYNNAKRLGFDEVYLSIIPNPVSVIDPGYHGMKYNRLLSRIQNHPGLKMPFIDLYSAYVGTSAPVYKYADSHWNWNGAYMWLNKFNNRIRKDFR